MQQRTVGVSPKVVIPTIVLVVLGAVIAVLDSIGVIEVDDSLWLGLLGAGGVTGATGYRAEPGQVYTPADETRDLHEVA